jgi:hypothetical protein
LEAAESHPEDGTHPNPTANTRTSNGPNTILGTHTPVMANAIGRWSRHEFARLAANTPVESPATREKHNA